MCCTCISIEGKTCRLPSPPTTGIQATAVARQLSHLNIVKHVLNGLPNGQSPMTDSSADSSADPTNIASCVWSTPYMLVGHIQVIYPPSALSVGMLTIYLHHIYVGSVSFLIYTLNLMDFPLY